MFPSSRTLVALTAAVVFLGLALPAASADEALDKALEALKTFDWGQDRSALGPIDAAVAASKGDKAAQKDLETRLAALLGSDASQAAKDVACRQLSLVGSAACVPAVAPLLTDEKLSHMARYALERIPAPEAVAAMRGALPKVKGRLKVGVINSLGVRRDAKGLAALVALLEDSDKEIASAAAAAVGAVGTPEAAKALNVFQAKAPKAILLAVADARLSCAERLLADGKKADAMAIYKSLSTADLPKHVQVAARRGLLAALGKK
ncbi:HEAT repeat domain-containing protein [Planctomycetota bacterium]